jgi:hypothetical protein
MGPAEEGGGRSVHVRRAVLESVTEEQWEWRIGRASGDRATYAE